MDNYSTNYINGIKDISSFSFCWVESGIFCTAAWVFRITCWQDIFSILSIGKVDVSLFTWHSFSSSTLGNFCTCLSLVAFDLSWHIIFLLIFSLHVECTPFILETNSPHRIWFDVGQANPKNKQTKTAAYFSIFPNNFVALTTSLGLLLCTDTQMQELYIGISYTVICKLDIYLFNYKNIFM